MCWIVRYPTFGTVVLGLFDGVGLSEVGGVYIGVLIGLCSIVSVMLCFFTRLL